MPQTRRGFLKTTLNAGIGASVTSFAGVALRPFLRPPQSASRKEAAPKQKTLTFCSLLPDQWRFDWMSTNKELPIRTPNL